MNTSPTAASCVFEREGEYLGTLPSTPGSLTVQKTKYNIVIRCDKPGYQQAVAISHSGTSAAIAANIALDVILTLGVSSIVDSAVGADNKYDSPIVLTLVPVPGSPEAAAAPVATIGATTDLKSLLSDKTLYTAKGEGRVVVDYYGADGKLARKDGECVRTGSWTVEEGKLCHTLATKEPTCYTVFGTLTQPAFRDVKAAADADAVNTRFMASGNTEKLTAGAASCP
ncbi:hypothetical protein [Zavarzinia aquatilis]|uniref:hypothetical protein n=1 Tax=Zavarzinia aquatilis TaxID=2211142 RepID=UPI001057DE78|nr:hypothetical protein [Zavarzinia aquatilis]